MEVEEVREQVAVDPQPNLPNPPATAPGDLASWHVRLLQQLRFVFSRYGMAINSNRLTADRNKMRSHFTVKF